MQLTFSLLHLAKVLAFREPPVRAIASRTATKCGICEGASSEAENWHTCSSRNSKTFDRTDFETHLGSRMVDARTSSRSPFEEDGLCAHMSPQPQQPTACGLLSRSTRFHLSHISGEPFNPHHLPSTTILHQVLTTPVASAESPLKGSRPRFGRERPR